MKLLNTLVMVFILFYCTNSNAQNIIQVVGNGQVEVQPDGLEFTIQIRERGALVSKLFATTQQKTTLVINTLEKQHIDAKDIQSMQMQVLPWFVYENQSREQRGFELSRQIHVVVRNTENMAMLFDAVFRIGNLEINHISLTVSEQPKHYQKALSLALNDAQAKAQLMAAQLNQSTGKVISLIELGNQSRFPEARTMMKSASTGDSFMPGEVVISAALEVQFAID